MAFAFLETLFEYSELEKGEIVVKLGEVNPTVFLLLTAELNIIKR